MANEHSPHHPRRPGGEGQRIGPYVIERELARGGMGVVYVAKHEALGRTVALKLLLAANERARERFLTEAQATARISHRNIVSVHEVGEHEGWPYLAMDLIDGEPLDQRLENKGPLAERDAARIAERLASALSRAHSAGVLHRDVKPANVLLTSGDEPMLVDFGLAKDMIDPGSLTKTGQMVGTPAYMAPEQARGDKQQIDARTDVYALGVTLYAMLVGHGPFDHLGGVALIGAVVTARRDSPAQSRPSLDPRLSALCLRAMAKSPADRHPTAAALADDLRAWLDGAARPWDVKKWALGLVATLVLVLAGFAATHSSDAEETPPATQATPTTPSAPAPTESPRAAAELKRIEAASPARRLKGLERWLRSWPRDVLRPKAEGLRRQTLLETPSRILVHPDCRGGVLVPEGRALTFGGKRVALWDLTGDEPVARWELDALVRQVAASPDGKGFAATTADGVYWTPFEGDPKLLARIPLGIFSYVLSFAPDGVLGIGLNTTNVLLLDTRGKVVARHGSYVGSIHALALSETRTLMGVVNELTRLDSVAGNALRLVDRATGRELALRKLSFKPKALAFAPSGERFALAGEGSCVVLFDGQDVEHPITLRGEGAGESNSMFGGTSHDGWMRGVAFDSDGRRLVSISGYTDQPSGRNEIRLWDAVSGEELWRATPRPHPYESCSIAPGGRLILAAAYNVGAELWDLSALND